jgi:DNA-binding response OmpR family regulator
LLTTQARPHPAPLAQPVTREQDQQRVRPRALVVIADASTSSRVTGYLERGGFQVEVLVCGVAAHGVLRTRPHVVIVDLQAQPEAMLSFCRELREATAIPMIACSLTHNAAQVVGALQAGADDVFILPMQTPEFVARVRAVVRRVRRATAATPAVERIVAGDVELWLREHRVYRNGRPVDLTPTEFRLLAVLARDSGRALSHKTLLKQAWGADYTTSRAMLRIYIRRLRTKLADDLNDPELIVAVRGVGYRLEPTVIAASSAA